MKAILALEYSILAQHQDQKKRKSVKRDWTGKIKERDLIQNKLKQSENPAI